MFFDSDDDNNSNNKMFLTATIFIDSAAFQRDGEHRIFTSVTHARVNFETGHMYSLLFEQHVEKCPSSGFMHCSQYSEMFKSASHDAVIDCDMVPNLVALSKVRNNSISKIIVHVQIGLWYKIYIVQL